MTDRKYRQRGYQDDGARDRMAPARKPAEPRDPRMPRDPRAPNMPGFRELFKCARCGRAQSTEVRADTTCSHCGVALHACVHCASFDAGAPFECRQTIPARVSPKDAANTCALFAPRISVERETGSAPASGSSQARKAFDDLFKF